MSVNQLLLDLLTVQELSHIRVRCALRRYIRSELSQVPFCATSSAGGPGTPLLGSLVFSTASRSFSYPHFLLEILGTPTKVCQEACACLAGRAWLCQTQEQSTQESLRAFGLSESSKTGSMHVTALLGSVTFLLRRPAFASAPSLDLRS